MLRDGTYKKVSDLKKNDRLMPFNHYFKTDKHGKYRFISLNNGNKAPEHRFIVEEIQRRKLTINEVVHHLDHNTLNNSIENLQIMDFVEHAKYHRLNEKLESKQKRIKTLKENCNPKTMQMLSRRFWDNLSDREYDELCEKRSEIALHPNRADANCEDIPK